MKTIGIDVDGVLADFNTTFIDRVIAITGHDLFPPRPFNIPTWDYPEYYGYADGEVSATWDSIKTDQTFWASLAPYAETRFVLKELFARQGAGDVVYFITNRMGTRPKPQTEAWLKFYGFPGATVMTSALKGTAALALGLDVYLDDRWENAKDVAGSYERVDNTVTWVPSKTTSYLFSRPWNVKTSELPQSLGVIRVASATEFLNATNAALLGAKTHDPR